MGSGYSELSNTDDNDKIIISSEQDFFAARCGLPARRHFATRPAVHLSAVNWLAPVRPEMVISCSSDKTIALNNVDTGACVIRWRGHEREVSKVVYKNLSCKHIVLSGSKDATIRLWKFSASDAQRIYAGHQMGVTGLATVNEDKFISGGRDGRLCLWDYNNESPIRTVTPSQNLITHVENSPDSPFFCQTAEDGSMRLWDSTNLAQIFQFPTKGHILWHCSLSNDSRTCLTSSGGSLHDGATITLWDLRQRKVLTEFCGHEGDVRCAIFLNQQQVTWKRLLLSASVDQTVRLWDLNTGRCLWTENIPSELNACIGFSDGSIVVGGGNATICDLRLLMKAGRPYLYANSIQSIYHDASK